MIERRRKRTKPEQTEIYTTEYIDKELPSIHYQKTVTRSMTEGESIVISVSDKTSQNALSTFRELHKEVNIEKRGKNAKE